MSKKREAEKPHQKHKHATAFLLLSTRDRAISKVRK